jgi:hypothetical protein
LISDAGRAGFRRDYVAYPAACFYYQAKWSSQRKRVYCDGIRDLFPVVGALGFYGFRPVKGDIPNT